MRSKTFTLLWTSLAAALLAGCMVGPNYEPPKVNMPADWGEQTPAATTQASATTLPSRTVSRAPSIIEWWTTFNDSELDALISRALSANLDLQLAQARVREARAERALVTGNLYPEINTSALYQHARASDNGVVSAFSSGAGSAVNAGGGGSPPGIGGSAAIPGSQLTEFDLYQAGFDASWEIDVFGGRRRAVQAASAQFTATVEQQHEVMLSLLGEVARNYIELRSLQLRLNITEQNLVVQKRSLDISTQQFERGIVNELDVSRAKAEVATTAAQLPSLRSAISRSIHRLSILLNQPPTGLTKELSRPSPLPSPPAEVPVGLPSALLLRRPDLRRAERVLAAQTAETGVAVADLFPRFSLTGSIGLQSTEPGNLVEYASRYYSIGPTISWPIFDAGRSRNRVRVAEARQDQATIAFEQTVLNALQDVEDSLVSFSKSQERTKLLQQAVAANQQSVRIASDLYAQGLTDFLSVLDAQRSLLSSEDALAVSQTEVSTSLVSLYKSLGGGWNVEVAKTDEKSGVVQPVSDSQTREKR